MSTFFFFFRFSFFLSSLVFSTLRAQEWTHTVAFVLLTIQETNTTFLLFLSVQPGCELDDNLSTFNFFCQEGELTSN